MQILLENGGASAVILDKGAELRSLKLSDREIMWCADPAFWGKSSPVLFPMIGNLRNGKTIIDGKEYSITKHGFARDNVFRAEQLSENSAVFSFSSDNNTKISYPFDFELKMQYTLNSDSLELIYKITNNSDQPMPYCIGAHPAFTCPFDDKEKFTDYKLIFKENENVSSPVMNLVTRMWGDNNRVKRLRNSREFDLDHSLFDNDCVYFDTIRSKNVLLESKISGRRVSLSWEGFETLGVWTPDHKNAPFVCIEPWCGCDDYDTDDGIFEHKRGIQIASPKETKEYKLTISE